MEVDQLTTDHTHRNACAHRRDPAVELVDPRYPSGKKLMIGYLRALLMGGVAGVRAMTALCTRLQPIGFTGADNHA